MTRRSIITAAMIIIGAGLMGFAYFAGAAPWCNNAVDCSNPRLEWSPAIFVAGVVIAFSSALYYAVAKDRTK